MSEQIDYQWRGQISDDEMARLVGPADVPHQLGWWDRVRPHSLGWVVGRSATGVAGFVNVAWDGFAHAFLLDTRVRADLRHRGIGTALVRTAASHSRAAGCEWLHVDFSADLASFYIAACDFRTTSAGLIHLPRLAS